MNITLYKFNKKVNSTARPQSTTTQITIPCIVKGACSITAPLIEVSKDRRPIGYNYAYIEDFNRYYFINDIVYNLGVWVLSLSCDVLASYYTEITGSSQYIMRNSVEYDTNIIDTFYPTKVGVSNDTEGIGVVTQGSTEINDYFNRPFNAGEFVIGVIGGNGSGITYYSLNYTGFQQLIDSLMSYVPSDMTDVANGIAKAIYDPLQYITCCYWYPYVVGQSSGYVNVKFGDYTVSISGQALGNSMILNNSAYISLPKHPQVNTRGTYLNVAPYSEYTLIFNPFGTIALDTTKMINSTQLRLNWRTDVTTGDSQLYVYGDSGALVSFAQATLGVPIRLSQVSTDVLGMASNVAGFIGGLLSLNPGAMFSNVLGAVNSAKPQMQTTGSSGSFLSFRSVTPRIEAIFNLLVDEDINHVGRPLCAIRRLRDLSGYTECGNAHIEIDTATENEKNEIVSYLSSGIYLEA